MRIYIEQVQFHPRSYADSNGRLFRWEGGLYRAISPAVAAFYADLLERGVIQRLAERKLIIDTNAIPQRLDGYPLVLKHREIPFVSYAPEWCAAMLRDAGVKVLKLQLALAAEGLTLQDAHAGNVLFDGPEPYWIDIGSIMPATDDTRSYALNEFHRYFVYPLLLMQRGQHRIARSLLHDHRRGVQTGEFEAVMGTPWRGRLLSSARRWIPAKWRPFARRIVQCIRDDARRPRSTSRKYVSSLQRLIAQIEAISVGGTTTQWSEYYAGRFPPFSPSGNWDGKHRAVYQVLQAIRPHTVLDLASNRGWFSQLAARLGARVVSTDVDEPSITNLYYDCRRDHLTITPLLVDFCDPMPGYGVCNAELAPATDRLKCDLVVALAIVHHLVFTHRLNFRQIVQGLSAFCHKTLLVEFVAKADDNIRLWPLGGRAWYGVEEFAVELRKEFCSVQRLPSNSEHRTLLVCDK